MNRRQSHISLISFILLITCPALAGQPVAVFPVRIPEPPRILSHLTHNHPRLLAGPTDWAQLRESVKSEPLLNEWKKKIEARANRILSEPPSRYEIPDGLRLLATSRRVLDRIYTLGLLFRLDGNPEYARRAWRELEAASQFPDWNPRHFLDTAEMTHAFAIGYDWFYRAWTAEQRHVLERAIVEKGLRPALASYNGSSPFGWWTKATHNWNQVCNGGIGLGALALADEEPDIAGKILHAALESIQSPMKEFAPDGAWKEGPGYWGYATAYNVVFLAALQSALGTDFGLSEMPAFAETGLFPIYLTGPTGRTFNYADGGDHLIRAPQMFWLARRFKRPVYAWYERQAATPAARDLLWSIPCGS